MIALLLLISGFSVIFFTFYALPKITQEFQLEREKASGTKMQETLSEVTELLRGESFTKMAIQVRGLVNSFRDTQESITKIGDLTAELSLIRDQGKPAIKLLEKQILASRSATEDLRVKTTAFNTNSVPLTEELSKLSKNIDEWVDPQKIKEQFEESAKQLVGFESNASKLLLEFSQVWDTKWERMPVAYINEKELAAIENIINWTKSDQESIPFETFRMSLNNISSKTRLIPISDSLKEKVRLLNINLSEMVGSQNELEKELLSVEKASTSLKIAMEQVENNKALSELGEGSKRLFDTISFASDVVSGSKESYDKTKRTLKKLEDATTNLSGIAQLQAELAFKGASPAIFLLLAIGGMFVTFGLSSMLKWVKDMDEKQAGEIWAKRNELYTEISIALVQQGVDPSSVISRLQSAFPTAESEHGGIKFPISETLSEIGKMLNPKK